MQRSQLAVVIVLMMTTRPGLAQPTAAAWERCGIEVAGSLSVLWAEALTRACEELAARQDLDQDARLRVTPGPHGGLTLQATLRDGRAAVRHVDSREGLTRTIAALLVLPTPLAAPTPAPAASAARATTDAIEPTTAPDSTKPPAVGAAPPATVPALLAEPKVAPIAAAGSWLHLGLSASVIGHVNGAPTYVGAGFALRVSLRVGAILVDASPRWEAAQASLRMRLPDFEMHSFGMTTFLGLRIWDDSEGAVETGLGMLVLAETQSYRAAGVELVGTVISVQPAMFARLLWGNPANLRWIIGLEANLAPRRFSHEVQVRDMLPPLPVFGVGLSFGGQWESS